jgi:hypothetical protein
MFGGGGGGAVPASGPIPLDGSLHFESLFSIEQVKNAIEEAHEERQEGGAAEGHGTVTQEEVQACWEEAALSEKASAGTTVGFDGFVLVLKLIEAISEEKSDAVSE